MNGGSINRGDTVAIREPGRRPVVGKVTAIKPSRVSGTWYEVRVDDDGLTLHVPESLVHPTHKEVLH